MVSSWLDTANRMAFGGDQMQAPDRSNNLEKALSNYHFSDLQFLTEEDGDVMKFSTSPKHGRGQEVLIRVIDGLFVVYTDLYVENGDSPNKDDYQKVISMYQLFDGEAQLNFRNGTACFIKKNDIVNFAGNVEFESTTSYQSHFVSVGLLCYYDELLEALNSLRLDTAVLKTYYQDVSTRQDVLIYDNDLSFSAVAKLLKDAVLSENIYLVKAKALELLYLGITNYVKFQDASRQKYNRKLLERIAKAKAQIDQNPQHTVTIPELAEYCGISPTYFKKIFKDCYGVQPHRYLIQRRLEEAKELLAKTDTSIAHIAEQLGFVSSSRFAETFKREYGFLPSAYRKEMNS